MSDCSTHAFDVPLKPCPFCGGEAVLHPTYDMDTGGVDGWFAWCDNDTCECKPETGQFFTEAEAIAAWNSRAPIEYEGWFYLPKPKEGIVQYGAPYVEEVENGYKMKQSVEVIESAIRSWGDELGDYVMKRICEVWNSRAERTCHVNELDALTQTLSMANNCSWGECSECGCLTPTDSVFCVECGARVVE